MTNEKRQQILIISAVAAVVLLAGDSFVLEPLLKSWSDRSKSIEALKQKVQRGTSLLRIRLRLVR